MNKQQLQDRFNAAKEALMAVAWSKPAKHPLEGDCPTVDGIPSRDGAFLSTPLGLMEKERTQHYKGTVRSGFSPDGNRRDYEEIYSYTWEWVWAKALPENPSVEEAAAWEINQKMVGDFIAAEAARQAAAEAAEAELSEKFSDREWHWDALKLFSEELQEFRAWKRIGGSNQGMGWVVLPDGSLREADFVPTHPHKSNPDGVLVWLEINPGELAIAWRKSSNASEHEFEVFAQPEVVTPAQKAFMAEREAEFEAAWAGRTGLASGKESPSVGKGWGFGESEAEVEADVKYTLADLAAKYGK